MSYIPGLQRRPFHRVWYRENLLYGVERRFFLLLALACFFLVFMGQSKETIAIAAFLWAVTMWALRRMAKADPQMSDVYLRHIKYRGYYAARTRPWCSAKPRSVK